MTALALPADPMADVDLSGCNWFAGRVTNTDDHQRELYIRLFSPVANVQRVTLPARAIGKLAFVPNMYTIGENVQGWFRPVETGLEIVKLGPLPDHPD